MMIDRILLVLTGTPATGDYSLTLEDAKEYSPRFFSGLLSEAYQHVRVKKKTIVYDLIVPMYVDDLEGLTLTDREDLFDKDFLLKIVEKVHSGSIRFRTVEFEPTPKSVRRGKR